MNDWMSAKEYKPVHVQCRSQKPSCLRRGSGVDRLLVLRVRILPRAWLFDFCKRVCCQLEGSASDQSPVQRSATDCGVSRVLQKPQK